MLTFTYRLKNFGKLKMPEREERGYRRFDRGDGPPPGMMQRDRSF
jgi:hypothetical protein